MKCGTQRIKENCYKIFVFIFTGRTIRSSSSRRDIIYSLRKQWEKIFRKKLALTTFYLNDKCVLPRLRWPRVSSRSAHTSHIQTLTKTMINSNWRIESRQWWHWRHKFRTIYQRYDFSFTTLIPSNSVANTMASLFQILVQYAKRMFWQWFQGSAP